MRWSSIAFAALSLTVPFALNAAAATTRHTQGSTYRIDIAKFKFKPATLEVPVGASVTWTNRDEEPHTVTSPDGKFKGSAAMDTGDTFKMVFTKPGTYTYFCTVHPFMTGTIVVH